MFDMSKAVLVFPCGTVLRLYPKEVSIRFPGDSRFGELDLTAYLAFEGERREKRGLSALPPIPAEFLEALKVGVEGAP